MQQEGYEKAKWQRCINHDDKDGLPHIMANPKKKMMAEFGNQDVGTHGIDELKICNWTWIDVDANDTNASS